VDARRRKRALSLHPVETRVRRRGDHGSFVDVETDGSLSSGNDRDDR
jgi:hypothetical protein